MTAAQILSRLDEFGSVDITIVHCPSLGGWACSIDYSDEADDAPERIATSGRRPTARTAIEEAVREYDRLKQIEVSV